MLKILPGDEKTFYLATGFIAHSGNHIIVLSVGEKING
jgi:hypothetical protein